MVGNGLNVAIPRHNENKTYFAVGLFMTVCK